MSDLNSFLKRRLRENNTCHLAEDGTLIKLTDLTDDYLIDIIGYIQNTAKEGLGDGGFNLAKYYEILNFLGYLHYTKELQRRKGEILKRFNNIQDGIYSENKVKFYFPDAWAEYSNNIKPYITERKKEYTIFPENHCILKAFDSYNKNLKYVILGQDPYHDGSACGLAFAVSHEATKTPPSLRNIEKKVSEYGKSLPIECWENCLLLNTALTVEKGNPNSHKKLWSKFTKLIISELNKKDNLIWCLWGANALSYKQYITNPSHKFIISSHPSPFSVEKTLGNYPAFKNADFSDLKCAYVKLN